MQGDTVDPGTKAGISMKSGDSTINLDEDFLGDVGRVRRHRQGARNQAVNGLMIGGYEPGEGLLRPCLELCDQGSLFRPYSNCARQITHGSSRLHEKNSSYSNRKN